MLKSLFLFATAAWILAAGCEPASAGGPRRHAHTHQGGQERLGFPAFNNPRHQASFGNGQNGPSTRVQPYWGADRMIRGWNVQR